MPVRSALLLMPVLVLALAAQGTPTAAPALAFLHVSVIPMDRERVLTDQTVIVRDDRIVAIGPTAKVIVPDGAMRIEARGQFLIPGLAEMHCHLVGGNNADTAEALNRRILLLNLAHGVTTVRGMLGHPRHLDLRARVDKGEVLGPTIVTSGPSFNGNSVPTPEAAVKLVHEQRAAGFDFLKIHPGASRATFDALAAAAKADGIPFAGHVPANVGLMRALEARYATIDHVDGYVEALAAGKVPADRAEAAAAGFFGFGMIVYVDESRIPSLVKATKDAGVAIVPTEAVMRAFLDDTPPADIAARPEMTLMPPATVKAWLDAKTKFNDGGQGLGTPQARARFFAVRAKVIKALHDGGVRLLLGADSPQVFAVPGHSIHRELHWLVADGLTPYQALATGTRNVAEFFGAAKDRGTIAIDTRADIVLVEANPLVDIGNAAKVVGVVRRGQWVTKADIMKQLDALPMP